MCLLFSVIFVIFLLHKYQSSYNLIHAKTNHAFQKIIFDVNRDANQYPLSFYIFILNQLQGNVS